MLRQTEGVPAHRLGQVVSIPDNASSDHPTFAHHAPNKASYAADDHARNAHFVEFSND